MWEPRPLQYSVPCNVWRMGVIYTKNRVQPNLDAPTLYASQSLSAKSYKDIFLPREIPALSQFYLSATPRQPPGHHSAHCQVTLPASNPWCDVPNTKQNYPTVQSKFPCSWQRGKKLRRGRMKRQMGMEKRYRDFCWLYLLDFLRYLTRMVVQAVILLDKQNPYVETGVCERA